MADQYVQCVVKPPTIRAERYHFGTDLELLRKLAQHQDADAELVEVAEWRCVLIRVGLAHDPDYIVVPDGDWLVYGRYLAVERARHFADAYELVPRG